MANFAIKTGINAVALWVAAAVLGGITLAQDGTDTGSKILTIVLVALIFGLINAVVKPIATILSLPALIVTLGLFTLIINAAMLQLLSWISGKVDLSFHVDNFFWDAIAGALIITLISWVLNILLDRDGD